MREHLHFRADGRLEFALRRQGKEMNGILEGYVTRDLGGEMRIRVHREGDLEILKKSGQGRDFKDSGFRLAECA